jgi:hypothetical protein
MIIKTEDWDKWVKNNCDPYGKCCIDVARKVMEILDSEPGDFDCHNLINRADDEIGAGGITGFMAGAVAQMVSNCHSRGKEFLSKWNKGIQIGNEGEKETEKGNALNPALLTIRR